jgi:RNA polymerase sigma-70 factor (sigma-E family)
VIAPGIPGSVADPWSCRVLETDRFWHAAEATRHPPARLRDVKPLTNAPVPPGAAATDPAAADPADQVTALYQAHALGLLRLAVIMLGERQAAEDVIQDAFLGLFRRWDSLQDSERALAYVRSSVFNGCRSVLRKRARNRQFVLIDPDVESAEARVVLGEEYREVLAALRRLPDRQREAVALRYCLDLSVDDVARAMGVAEGTVKSATSRGIAAISRMLKGDSDA